MNDYCPRVCSKQDIHFLILFSNVRINIIKKKKKKKKKKLKKVKKGYYKKNFSTF
jgi:hypothetical protein